MASRLISCVLLSIMVLTADRSLAQTPSVPPIRLTFKFDPEAPLAFFLPASPKSPAKPPHWTNEDLSKVPEAAFGDPLSKDLTKPKAMEGTAHILAKINHLNAKKTDGFMLALLVQRTDLRGLPFLMGEECRTPADQARVFQAVANATNQFARNPQIDLLNWGMRETRRSMGLVHHGHFDRAAVAASVQILMPKSEQYQVGLAEFLASVPHDDATKTLARLALFSAEEDARAVAIAGLKNRRIRDYTDILLQGFRYPLPAVSRRAAEALVKLERKDLLANLIDVLEQPDPRLPVTEKRDGKDVTTVRELVRVNHHRNCALCHAPGNTENVPDGVLTVAAPLPTEPLPKPTQGGYQSVPPASPDIVVRIDMTYLRQDFSMMMPVSDPHPWPELQRFDFLVRTRVVTASEAQMYEQTDEPGRLAPTHRAALYALRELTGRDTEPTATGWRKLLKLRTRD